MQQEKNIKKLDTRDYIRVVTSNEFLKIEGLCNLKLNSLKLLYLTISQVHINDDKFYTCKITTSELAKLWGISRQAVNKCYDDIIKELHNFSATLKKYNDYGEEKEYIVHLISMIVKSLDKKKNLTTIELELDHNANDLFLNLDKNFSRPLLFDFNKMRSVNSILLWHLIQVKAASRSKKPVGYQKINAIVTVDEIRKITGTINKHKLMSDLRKRVIDQAIKEIYKNCNVKIEYTPIKEGKNIIAFNFKMGNKYAIPKDKLSERGKEMLYRAEKFTLLKN